MAKKTTHVVKPSRCAHPQWVFFARSSRNGGYYRCPDCGSVQSGKQRFCGDTGAKRKLSDSEVEAVKSLSQNTFDW